MSQAVTSILYDAMRNETGIIFDYYFVPFNINYEFYRCTINPAAIHLYGVLDMSTKYN